MAKLALFGLSALLKLLTVIQVITAVMFAVAVYGHARTLNYEQLAWDVVLALVVVVAVFVARSFKDK